VGGVQCLCFRLQFNNLKLKEEICHSKLFFNVFVLCFIYVFILFVLLMCYFCCLWYFFVNFYFLSMLKFSMCFCGVSFLQNQPLLMQTYIWNEKELHCHLHLLNILVNIQHFFIYIYLHQHFFGIMHHSKSEWLHIVHYATSMLVIFITTSF
jgi:hypothetical protein